MLSVIQKVVGVVLLEIAFILILTIIWASNKGFDFTDESFYILTLIQVDESPNLYYFHHLIHGIFGWMKPGYVGYRLIRLFLTIISALVLAFGLRSWLRKFLDLNQSLISAGYIFFLALAIISIAVSYSIFPQAISYNSSAVINLAFIMGLMFLYDFYLEPQYVHGLRGSIFFLGWFSTMLFFSRFTSGISIFVMIPFTTLFLVLAKSFSIKIWIRDMIFYLLGIILALSISSLFFHSVFIWIKDFIRSTQEVAGHSVDTILDTYWNSILVVYDTLLNKFLFYPLLFLVWVNIKNRISIKNMVVDIGVHIISLLLLSLIVYATIQNSIHLSGVQYLDTAVYFYILLMFISIAVLINPKTLKKVALNRGKTVQLIFVLLFIFSLPFIGSVGTDNKLHIQVLQFMFSWIIISFFFMALIYKYVDKLLAIGLLLILVVGSASQTIYGLVYSPYRINGTLLTQNKEITLKTGDRLMLDPNTAQEISNYEKIINGISNYEKGDPMIVLTGIPGFIYLANASVVKKAWTNQAHTELVCKNLERTNVQELENLIIVSLRQHQFSNELIQCLNKNNIEFPGKYSSPIVIKYPMWNMELDLWAPKERN